MLSWPDVPSTAVVALEIVMCSICYPERGSGLVGCLLTMGRVIAATVATSRFREGESGFDARRVASRERRLGCGGELRPAFCMVVSSCTGGNVTPRCDGPGGVVAAALAVRCWPRWLANERAVFRSMAGGVLATWMGVGARPAAARRGEGAWGGMGLATRWWRGRHNGSGSCMTPPIRGPRKYSILY